MHEGSCVSSETKRMKNESGNRHSLERAMRNIVYFTYIHILQTPCGGYGRWTNGAWILNFSSSRPSCPACGIPNDYFGCTRLLLPRSCTPPTKPLAYLNFTMVNGHNADTLTARCLCVVFLLPLQRIANEFEVRDDVVAMLMHCNCVHCGHPRTATLV